MTTRLFSLLLVLCAGLPFTALCETPTGYDWVVSHHGGPHIDTISDPTELTKRAATWAQSPAASLAFFTSELGSSDPRHVKAGILSIAILARAVDYTGPNQVSAEAKAQFDKNFPVEQLKKLLSSHPEYAEWLMPLRSTERARAFPQLQSPPP